MRTAIITGLTHEGKGVLISGKEVGLLKQLEIFKTFKIRAALDGSHPEYKEVSYQEADSGEQLVRFKIPVQATPPPPAPAPEFKREELQSKSQGELLAIMKSLVESKRIDEPKKTSPTALIDAILAAKPVVPTP